MNSYRADLKLKYPDCWRWISLARQMPGELTENEASLIFRLARARTPEINPLIVALGSGQEKTSLFWAAGLRGKTNPRIFSTQPCGATGGPLRCRPRDVVKAATDWAECNAAIDILFINATADYEALHSDLSHWSPFVKLGGVVILQGSSPELPKYLQPPRYSDVRHIDSLAWGVKQCASSVAVQTIEARPQTDIATARHQDYIRRSIREVAENRHAIRELHRSWSWRLTAPLRWGGNVSQAISGLIASLGQGASGARIAGLKQWLLYRNRVRASGLFDERYYRDQHPSVAWARNSPLLHFFVCGAGERNSPNELFDVDYYLRCYPEVAQSCANPLVHYLNTGAYEGKNPHPYFDSSFYLEQNPDVRESRINPLAHYLAPGIAEGRDPNPWFDTSDYLDKNVDVVTFGLNPLTHYLCSR